MAARFRYPSGIAIATPAGMDHNYAISGGSAGYEPRTAGPSEAGQVAVAVQQQEKALSLLGEAVEALENRLGFGLRPAPPAAVASRDERPMAGPSRSTLADRLQVANARINDSYARLTDITSRVDL